MSTTTPLTDNINALTAYSNQKTGADDTTLSDAVVRLVDGYGAGGADGITIKSMDSENYVTEIDFYMESGIVPTYMFGAPRADIGYYGNRLTTINLKNESLYLSKGSFVRSALTEISTSVIKGWSKTRTYNSNNDAWDTFRYSPNLVTLSLPEFVGLFNHYEAAQCSKLKTIYLPKVTKYASYGSGGRGCFYSDTALENVQLGSVGYPVTAFDTKVFGGCTSAFTVIVYAVGDYVDTIVTNIRGTSTNATIIIKAAENTIYNNTSYSAGDTILTDTPSTT